MHMRIAAATLRAMTWSEFVRRHTAGMTQKQIGDQVGIAQGSVSRWFTGAEPTAAHVLKFADAFGLDYTEAFLHSAGMDDREVRTALRRVHRRGR